MPYRGVGGVPAVKEMLSHRSLANTHVSEVGPAVIGKPPKSTTYPSSASYVMDAQDFFGGPTAVVRLVHVAAAVAGEGVGDGFAGRAPQSNGPLPILLHVQG